MAASKTKLNWTRFAIIAAAVLLLAGLTSPYWLPRLIPGFGSNVPKIIPTPDFPEGSKAVYTAKFSDFPSPTTDFGTIVQGAGNTYTVKANSNHWVGNAPPAIIPALEHDFVLDVKFKLQEGDPIVQLQLGGSAENNERVTVELSRHGKELSYHLEKGRVTATGAPGGHQISSESIVERAFVNPVVSGGDSASAGGKLTLKRDGDKMSFFLNNEFLQEFPASAFPYNTIYLAVAQKSVVEFSSVEVRVRP